MPPSWAATFGELLREYRLATGLTQEALAERAGLSVFGIQKLERGTTQPYPDTARRLFRALALSAADQARFDAAIDAGRRNRTRRQATPDGKARHNLPLALTSFVGRDSELREIHHTLASTRLLTLTGVGGCGKTRLHRIAEYPAGITKTHQTRKRAFRAPAIAQTCVGIEVARGAVADYPHGVWLVELGPIADSALVTPRVATTLGVRETAELPLGQSLLDALRARRLLLVLDNCEHLLDACGRLLDDLLRTCADVRVLATSREPIGIAGEVVRRVPSLALPDGTLPATPRALDDNPCVRLFVDRAQSVQPRFGVSERNASAVVQISRQLDGIPLALELAAARLGTLTVEQLAVRLDQRFRLLTGGSRTALPRQQTLAGALDWSYHLLTGPERRLFELLAIFTGGWTLEAGEGMSARLRGRAR